MNNMLTLTFAWLSGGVLGTIFFGGLWLTIRKATASQRPTLWFSLSLLLRMGIAIAGFYVVGQGHWERLAACLLGFIMARLVVTWFTRSSACTAGSTKGGPSCG